MVQFRRVIFSRKWLHLFIVECLFPARLSSHTGDALTPTLQLHPSVSASFFYSLRTFRLLPCPAPHRNHPRYFLRKTYGMWISGSPSPQTRKIVFCYIFMSNKSSHYYKQLFREWLPRLMHYILSSTAVPALGHSSPKQIFLNIDFSITRLWNLRVKLASILLIVKAVNLATMNSKLSKKTNNFCAFTPDIIFSTHSAVRLGDFC